MATFAEEQVERFETLLAEAVGVKTIEVDGQRVTYQDLKREYAYWKRVVGREKGTRPTSSQIKLSNF